MENINRNQDQLQQNLTHLTGAFNAQMEAMRVWEERMRHLEARIPSPAEVNPAMRPQRTEQELEAIKKLPDCVRDLQIFDGDATQYVSWISNVESILADYQIARDKPIFQAIVKHIRQKIRGPADNALVSYNIFHDTWENIKKCLSLHYADKRDIQSLENQLNLLRQGRDTVDQFYNRVNYQLSLIINKIKTDDYSQDGMAVLVENYRHRALDVFIRGLQQNLAHLIKVQKPSNLPEAYTACLELQNMDYRKSISNQILPYRNAETYNSGTRKHPQQPMPIRQNYDQNYQSNFQQKPFIPSNNQYVKQFSPQNNIPPPRPTQPKPPVPMEVDRSIQTARVNYMNRPRPMVRHGEGSSNIKPKNQRMFNLETPEYKESNNEEQLDYEDNAEEEYLQHFEEEVNLMTGTSLEYPS